MKLLLTSAGVTNKSIADALKTLTGRVEEATKIGFVTTAANVEPGNKDWYISQLTNLQKYGYSWIDIIDPSAPGVAWQQRLDEVDVVFVSGGNTFHLIDQYRRTGFDRWIKANLDKKVYVGVSAGTIVTTPSIDVCTIEPSDPNLPGLTDLSGMGLVDFEVEPHCDEQRFVAMENYAKKRPNKVYAIDDESAIKVDGGVEVISNGSWKVYSH